MYHYLFYNWVGIVSNDKDKYKHYTGIRSLLLSSILYMNSTGINVTNNINDNSASSFDKEQQ
jgi:hypothetical protein